MITALLSSEDDPQWNKIAATLRQRVGSSAEAAEAPRFLFDLRNLA